MKPGRFSVCLFVYKTAIGYVLAGESWHGKESKASLRGMATLQSLALHSLRIRSMHAHAPGMFSKPLGVGLSHAAGHVGPSCLSHHVVSWPRQISVDEELFVLYLL